MQPSSPSILTSTRKRQVQAKQHTLKQARVCLKHNARNFEVLPPAYSCTQVLKFILATIELFYYTYTRMIMKSIITIITAVSLLAAADPKIIVSIPFGTNFKPVKTVEGDILSVTAIAADSSFLYLYDMADRTLAILDSNGTFIKKTPLQTIGRKTYIGDDFIVTKKNAVFLNTVDFMLEVFDLESGVLKKRIAYPPEIPGDISLKRLKKITRIFIDNNVIYLGNIHSIFPFNPVTALSKNQQINVIQFSASKPLLLYNSTMPLFSQTGTILYAQKSTHFPGSDIAMSGKRTCVTRNAIVICTVDTSGIILSRVGLTE